MGAFLAWELLVTAGIIGWGYLARRVLLLRLLPPRVAIDMVLGLGALGFVAATAMLLFDPTPRWWSLLVAIGVGGMVWRTIAMWRASAARQGATPWSRIAVSVVSIAVIVAFAAGTVVTRVWNPCDDDPAYLYLARRVWSQGNLSDAFNNRRLTSSGLFSVLQGITIGPFHDGALYAADVVLGSLLVLFVLWRRRDGSVSAVGLTIALVVVTSLAVFGATNSSPVVLPFAIVLCALDPVLWRAGAPGRDNAAFVAISVSVVTLMRPHLGFVIAGVFVAYQLVWRLPGWTRRLAVFAGSGLAAATPWLLMSKRDSGTWFYPVFAGNLSKTFPFGGYRALVDRWDYFWDALTDFFTSSWPLALGVALVVTYLVTSWGSTGGAEDPDAIDKRQLRSLHVLVVAIGVVFVFVFALSVRRSGLPGSFPRFWAPLLAAAVVMVWWVRADVKIPDRRLRRAATALCLVAVALLFIPSVNRVWTRSAYAIDAVAEDRYSDVITASRYPVAERQYETILDRIPRNARVLVATPLPHLLLRRDLDVQTIDIAGATSPDPEFPFGGTEAAKVAWLREHRFDYVVVATPDDQSCLFGRGSWLNNLGRKDIYEDWAPYVLEWIDFADGISPSAVHVAGDAALVRVRDIQVGN